MSWGNKEVVTVAETFKVSGSQIIGATGALSAVNPGNSVYSTGATGPLSAGFLGVVKTKNEHNSIVTLHKPVAGATAPVSGVGIFVSQIPTFVDPTKANSVFFVDTTEMGVAANKKGQHAGWVQVKTGSGGRAGRKIVETLVAMGVPQSTSGDREDTEFPDS